MWCELLCGKHYYWKYIILLYLLPFVESIENSEVSLFIYFFIIRSSPFVYDYCLVMDLYGSAKMIIMGVTLQANIAMSLFELKEWSVR